MTDRRLRWSPPLCKALKYTVQGDVEAGLATATSSHLEGMAGKTLERHPSRNRSKQCLAVVPIAHVVC